MRHLFLPLTLIAFLHMGCPTSTPPVEHPSVDASDAAPAADVVAGCVALCRHANDDLHCPGALATANAATCQEVCENTAPMVGWDLQCRGRAQSCQAIDDCESASR